MTNSQKERELIARFIDGAYLEGSWSREVPIPDADMLKQYSSAENGVSALARVHHHRIDLLYNCVDEIWILEAKLMPDPGALGQLLCYRTLFAEWQGIGEDKIRLGLICEHDNYLLRPILEKHGVRIWVI